MPSPSDKFISQIEQLFVDFIWNGRRAKIPLKYLKADKKKGGANLTDLRLRDMSMKISWLQIIDNDEKCKELAFQLINPMLAENIFRCNLEEKDIKDLNIGSHFWTDVMKAWCAFNDTPHGSVFNQTIWFNSRIRIAGTTIFNEQAYSKGLLWVSQLYESNKLISARDALTRFHLSIMEFNGIISAIPTEWRMELKRSTTTQHWTTYDVIRNKNNLSHYIYSVLKDRELIQLPVEKCVKSLGIDVSENQLSTAFKSIHYVTNVTKYRSFQYRFLHASLVTNAHLYRWGILSTNGCTFCGDSKETMQHLFFECVHTKLLWQSVQEYVHVRSPESKTNWDRTSIALNSVVKGSGSYINYVCLIVKQFIYRQRCLKLSPSIEQLKIIISKCEKMEKYIAVKNNKIQRHNIKWNSNVSRETPDVLELCC